MDREDESGIYEYDINTDQHQLIASYKSFNFHPGGCVVTQNGKGNKIYFVGSVDVKNQDKEYDQIFQYDLEHHSFRSFEFKTVGSYGKAIIANNDNNLHIVGGEENEHHIIYNLLNKKENMFIHLMIK